MATWHLAPSLVVLRDEVNKRWPNRSKTYDGTIGDAAHAARTSEHNPDNDPDPMPKGAVSAMDITANDASLRDTLLGFLIGDDRVWYVINRGYIYSRTYNWAERKYTGDPHTHHIHVSLRQTKAAHDSKARWLPAAVTYHTVVAGEYLGSIAEKYGTTVNQLVAWNGIKNPNVIQVGQKLRVR